MENSEQRTEFVETLIQHFIIDLITLVLCIVSSLFHFFFFRNEQNMAPTQNSTLINLINDDIKSITSERLSPITVQELYSSASSDNEVRLVTKINEYYFLIKERAFL